MAEFHPGTPGSIVRAVTVCVALALCGCAGGAPGGSPTATSSPLAVVVPCGPSQSNGADATAVSSAVFGSIGSVVLPAQAAGGGVDAMCSSGRIIVITDRLDPPAPADGSVQAVPGLPLLRTDTALGAAERLLPADQQMSDDVTKDSCRVVRFTSATVGAELPAADPAGIVDVVLASAAGADFHQQQIAQVRLQVGHGDSPSPC